MKKIITFTLLILISSTIPAADKTEPPKSIFAIRVKELLYYRSNIEAVLSSCRYQGRLT